MSNVRKMTMTIGEKIRAVRLEKGFSQRELQQRSGVERNFISLVENNHRSPSFKTLVRIAEALGVSVGYITDYVEKTQNDENKQTAKISYVRTLKEILDDFESGPDFLKYTQFFPTPIVNEATLASDVKDFKEDDIEDYVFISSKLLGMPLEPGRYRCIWIKDDKQALPPLIQAGSLVCVDAVQREPRKLEGEIVVFQEKTGNCSIKRLRFHGEHMIGMPDEANHQPPLIVPISEQEVILGKVVWCWSKFGK